MAVAVSSFRITFINSKNKVKNVQYGGAHKYLFFTMKCPFGLCCIIREFFFLYNVVSYVLGFQLSREFPQ